jgi:hypothetical protein
MTDSGATWVVNGWAGASVLCGSSTGTVSSNTATVLTVASWSGGTPSSTSAYTITGLNQLWTATPQLTTGIPTLDTVSLEYAESDGSSNHLLGSAAYGTTESFKFGWAFNKEATFSAVMNARANLAPEESTFCVPLNRSGSVLASLTGEELRAAFHGTAGVRPMELVAAALIVAAVAALTFPALAARAALARAWRAWTAPPDQNLYMATDAQIEPPRAGWPSLPPAPLAGVEFRAS